MKVCDRVEAAEFPAELRYRVRVNEDGLLTAVDTAVAIGYSQDNIPGTGSAELPGGVLYRGSTLSTEVPAPGYDAGSGG